jgi:hypothetical protein
VTTYEATTTISATPVTIWKILADASRYPDWDPGIVRVEGSIALGEKVNFFTKFNPDRALAVRVTVFDRPNKMVLTGDMPLGLFKSERMHSLAANEDGTTTFHTQEVFSGLLLPLIGKRLPDLNEDFERFAAGLKAQAEQA